MRQIFPFLKPTTEALPPWDRPLFETDNFVVVPTVGAIVEGWILIVPRKPLLCMGALPVEEHDELQQIVNLFVDAINESYGEVAIFEHGPACTGTRIGCGVDHAHLHILPPPRLLHGDIARVTSYDFRWKSVKTLAAASEYHRRGSSYLYVEQPLGHRKIAVADEAPSQLFRRVIAFQVGLPDRFDWRTDAMEHNVLATIERLSSWLASNPDRVGSLGACVVP